MFHASHALLQSAFFHGEIRRNREKIGSGLLTLDVRQRINGVTKTGIAVFALHYHLQIRGVPNFARDGDGLVVADFSRGNQAGEPCALRADTVQRLCA